MLNLVRPALPGNAASIGAVGVAACRRNQCALRYRQRPSAHYALRRGAGSTVVIHHQGEGDKYGARQVAHVQTDTRISPDGGREWNARSIIAPLNIQCGRQPPINSAPAIVLDDTPGAKKLSAAEDVDAIAVYDTSGR